MKTVVETFIIEETQELIYDNDKLDKWNQYVEELGLKGQKLITSEGKSPVPFLHMKESLVNVFQCLCPSKTPLEKYDRTPIPVEILDLIALSKKENYFHKIEIWYDEETPDPVAIGYVKTADWKAGHEWWDRNYNKYLIARWADVKQSLEELTAKAKTLFKQKKKIEIEQAIKNANRQLEDLDNYTEDHFGIVDSNFKYPF